MITSDAPAWRKSTRSLSEPKTCVEVADLGGGRRGFRDSTFVRGGENVSPVLDLEAAAFSRFVQQVKTL